ncbi:hypothetical protein M3Y98_00615100 [Aphelenchoides besseyi]|nr:hypothetical protein M3Y98_00615100 [Aphelenchoides besseyi]
MSFDDEIHVKVGPLIHSQDAGPVVSTLKPKRATILLISNAFNPYPTYIVTAWKKEANNWCEKEPWKCHESYRHSFGFTGAVHMEKRKKIYLAGGSTWNRTKTIQPACRTVRCLDTENLQPSNFPFSLQNNRGAPALAALSDNQLMACGGFELDTNMNYKIHRSTEILNLDNETEWQFSAQLNYSRMECCATNVNGKIYVTGGYGASEQPDSETTHSSVEWYDPEKNQWFVDGSVMRQRRSFHSAIATRGGVLVVVGGAARRADPRLKELRTSMHSIRSCEFYDPRQGRWNAIARMICGRFSFGLCSVGYNDDLLSIGGFSSSKWNDVGRKTERYDWRADKWVYDTSLLYPRGGHHAFYVPQADLPF